MTEIQFLRHVLYGQTDTPKNNCPHCNRTLNMTTDPTGHHVPSAGDASVCLYCNKIMVFTEGLGVRKPTPMEEMEIGLDPQMIDIQIRIANRPRKKRHVK